MMVGQGHSHLNKQSLVRKKYYKYLMAWKNRWGVIEKGTIAPKIMEDNGAHKCFENKR
jgi:hypothetical protein